MGLCFYLTSFTYLTVRQEKGDLKPEILEYLGILHFVSCSRSGYLQGKEAYIALYYSIVSRIQVNYVCLKKLFDAKNCARNRRLLDVNVLYNVHFTNLRVFTPQR